MSTVKDVLCLLFVLIAYGIAGGMDYDDAVMLEEAQHLEAPLATECECSDDAATEPAIRVESALTTPCPRAMD